MLSLHKTLLLSCVGIIMIVSSHADADTSGGGVSKNQHLLVQQWADSLIPDVDYNGTIQWRKTYGSNDPSHFFFEYSEKFSKMAEKVGATVNFVSVGACDGTEDPVIKNGFLAHPHWNGVFIEPMSNNFADLTKMFETHGVTNRSTAIKGAATAECISPFIEVQRPLFEEKDPTLAHWMRRQIGGIVQKGSKAPGGWTIDTVRNISSIEVEYTLQLRLLTFEMTTTFVTSSEDSYYYSAQVRCLTAEEILHEWGQSSHTSKK